MTVTKRGLVRIISFAIAISAFSLAGNISLASRNKNQAQTIEYSYLRAVEDLSAAADNITATLEKGIYSGTPEMLSSLSSKLWRESTAAKAALSQLPTAELQLENTYKFLSQVGNYALSLSEKVRDGEKLTEDQYKKLSSLYDFSKEFSADMWELEARANNGQLSLDKVTGASEGLDEETPPTVTEGFTDFEEGFDSYPTLIYDGPFSDHILEKKALMLEDAEPVSEDKAKSRAATAANLNMTALDLESEEEGVTPSYVFSGKGVTVSITKNGCYINYMLKSRQPQAAVISNSTGVNLALDYLDKLGIENMTTTYYEAYDNVLTINFACKEGDVIYYTDLIKVSVALDNGEILGFDARGYIVNHTERKLKAPEISEDDARNLLSPLLEVQKSRLAVIPSDSQNEVYCYEFTCTAQNGRKVLVYIDTQTGKEEQILLLFESDSGVLTM